MAYIGRGTDNISNVEVLDNITFSGASSYTLQKGGANYVPISAANILVSIDGVVQANNFSVSGSTIDFGVAIANTSTCNFVLHFGTGLITTVQDGAVTTAKIGSSAITSAKMASNSIATASVIDDAITYAKMQDTSAANRVLGAASAGTIGEVQVSTDMIADAQVDESKLKISNSATNGYFLSAQSGNTGGLTWAQAGGGGKILQVKSVTFKDAFTSTAGSGTFVNITGATLAITPSATTSKILFQAMITTGAQTYGVVLKIQRNGSDIAGALGTVTGNRVASTAYSSGHSSDDAEMQSTYMSYLDSPSSTSALTYTVQGSARYQPAAVAWTVNYPHTDTNANYTAHSVSTITLMEVGA